MTMHLWAPLDVSHRWWLVDELLWSTTVESDAMVVVTDVADYLMQVELGARAWRLLR